MAKILSFVKLDFLSIKSYWKGLLMMLGIGILMGIFLKSAETISSYLTVMLVMTMSYPFAVGEKNKMDILYGTLSINKNNIVIGRYCFVLFFAIAGTVISTLIGLLFSAILKQTIVIPQMLLTNGIFFAGLCLVIAVQFPIFFKYGYNKAKAAILMPLFIVFGAMLFVPMIADLFNLDLTNFIGAIFSNPIILIVLIVIFSALALIISCIVSIKIYKKKDI